MPLVFISHSSRDTEFVEREVVSLLKGNGIDVWYSKDNIETAAEWEKRIKLGLKSCEWFIVVLSPDSVVSDWVQSEVDWALDERKGRVIPLFYRDCDPTELHIKLRRIQHIDFRGDPEPARRKLLAVWGVNSAARADEELGKAVEAIAQQEWDVAISNLNVVVSRSPGNDEAKTLLDYARRQRDAAGGGAAPAWDGLTLEPFPDAGTIHWTPTPAAGEGGGARGGAGRVLLVVTQEVLLRVNEHAAQTLERELCGFLLGNRYLCPNSDREYVVIDQYSLARLPEPTAGSIIVSGEAWGHLSDDLQGKFRGKLLVGWYHSHPRMSVFLSSVDMKIQAERFAEPWMTALVIEPEKHQGGFFTWRDGGLNQHEPSDFYEYLRRNTRESVVAWTNYSGTDPRTGAEPAVAAVNTRTVSPGGRYDEINSETGAPMAPAERRRRGSARAVEYKTALQMSAPRGQIFISYSHADKEWFYRLRTMLAPLVRSGLLTVRADTDIGTGDRWREEMSHALASAKVAVLLVSQNFLNSEFIAEHELPSILDAARRDGLRVLWVAVGHCLYRETEIADYQAANDPARPLDSLPAAELNGALVRVCEQIAKAAKL